MASSSMAKWSTCVGRLLLSLIFVMSGVHKLTAWNETASQMESEGMLLVPLFLVGAIVFELAGGLSVMLGIKPRWGAILLIVFLIPTTLIFHDFWTYEGQEQQRQMINFMKNLAIMGGLFVVTACETGGGLIDQASSPTNQTRIKRKGGILIGEIEQELDRIVGREAVQVSDIETDSEANRRVKLETANAIYELPANRVLIFLQQQPSGIDVEALRQAIEAQYPSAVR